MMFFALFAGKFFSLLVNKMFNTELGVLLDLKRVINGLWAGLLGIKDFDGPSAWSSFIVLALVSALCLWILNRKIRAYEVVS
jgi:hypothetical protein